MSQRLSVQLYTVREALADDLEGTLNRLAQIGFTQVEPFGLINLGERLGNALEAAGLTAPTAHQRFVGEDQDAVFGLAQKLGIGTVIDPHIDDERWTTTEGVAGIAVDLNAAAKRAADFGIRIGYHNHAHELTNILDGTPALEYLAARLDDDVFLELDTYWVVVGGQDPVRLEREFGDRVVALHLKDGPGTHEDKDQVAVGSGSMPIREIIEAAPNALRVIELDDSRGDRFQAVADSFAFLTAEGLA